MLTQNKEVYKFCEFYYYRDAEGLENGLSLLGAYTGTREKECRSQRGRKGRAHNTQQEGGSYVKSKKQKERPFKALQTHTLTDKSTVDKRQGLVALRTTRRFLLFTSAQSSHEQFVFFPLS